MKTIKSIILVLLLFLFSNSISAQGFNLEFSRAIFQKIAFRSVVAPEWGKIPITIPSGKVWKIEGSSTGNAIEMQIDSIRIAYDASKIISTQYPIWLPAGTYELKLLTNYATFYCGFISGIEYNLVP